MRRYAFCHLELRQGREVCSRDTDLLARRWWMSCPSILTEQEVYAILDLGPELDHRAMAKEGTLQLIVGTLAHYAWGQQG